MTMDAIELLMDDHRTVEGLFADFRAAEPEARQPIAEELIKELSIHAAIEETVFYPAVREDIPKGDPLVEHSLDEHHDIKAAAARVDDVIDKAHTKDCEQKVLRLEEFVQHHVDEEETKILPKVRQALTQSRLDELATKLRAAKKSAPTRPHPSAPDEGVAAEVTGKAAGVVDRARDAMSGRSS